MAFMTAIAKLRPATTSAAMRREVIAVITLAFAAMLAPDASADPAATSTTEALYKKGKTSFRKRCARCHGVNMMSPGVGVFDLRIFPPDDKARFVDSVSNGKNAMPSWGAVLKPEDIDALWLYVTTTSP
jgi:mono/diheme cytochrome c family protein